MVHTKNLGGLHAIRQFISNKSDKIASTSMRAKELNKKFIDISWNQPKKTLIKGPFILQRVIENFACIVFVKLSKFANGFHGSFFEVRYCNHRQPSCHLPSDHQWTSDAAVSRRISMSIESSLVLYSPGVGGRNIPPPSVQWLTIKFD